MFDLCLTSLLPAAASDAAAVAIHGSERGMAKMGWDGQLTGNWTTENCRDVNFSRGGMKSFET